MSAPLLRKLTRKSKFGFGEFWDDTVERFFERGRINRLAWYYYYKSNITYTDDILEEIGIIGDLVIEKPSADGSKFKIWKEKNKDLDSSKAEDSMKVVLNGKLANCRNHKNRRVRNPSKSKMQSKNHGK